MTLYFKDPSVVTGEGESTSLVKVLQNEAGSIRLKKVERIANDDAAMSDANDGDEEDGGGDNKFGPWDGVMVSCLLNIFGVIMFLRLGWVVGQAGIILAIVIVLMSGVVTTVTTMSMAAICTNGEVKAGGAYYMISRSIGPDFGGAIGILFTLGQCVACAMYVIGFCETLTGSSQLNVGSVGNATASLNGTGDDGGEIFSMTGGAMNDMRLYGIGLITVLLVMALYGVGWVIKLQIALLTLLLATIGSFCIGCIYYEDENADLSDTLNSDFQETDGVEYTFFSVFAVFFPAVTGIMAGANISGLLRNPSSDIPKGTFHAIGWSTIVYCIMAFLVGMVVSREDLLSKYTIMADIDLTGGFLVIGGVYAATFSSALASIVGAPQLLSSVARDELFGFLSYFKVTHRRQGFRFIEAPFVEGVSSSFLRKLKWYMLAQCLYSEDDSHSVSLQETWKKLRQLFEGRLDASKMIQIIVERGVSRPDGMTMFPPFGTAYKPYTSSELDSMSSDALETVLVDHLIAVLERPHQAELDDFVQSVFDGCLEVDRGESKQARTGLLQARDLCELLRRTAKGQSSRFSPEHLVTFIMNADVKDHGSRCVRYGRCVKIADPIRGYFVCYAIACGFIVMGDLNAVAPLISMFFMMTYGMINYSCFSSTISKSPGWRPTFKYYNPWVSLFGAILCVVCMFLTDVYFALAAIVIAGLLWQYVSVSEPTTDWGPATDAAFFKSSVKSVMKLRRMNVHHAKTFRPNYLVLTHGSKICDADKSMLRFVYTLRKGGGLAIVGHVRQGSGFVDTATLQEDGHYICPLTDDVRHRSTQLMHRLGLGINKDRGYMAYTQVVAPSFTEGGRMLISCSGLGSLRPNTVMIRYPDEWARVRKGTDRAAAKTGDDSFRCEDWFKLVQGATKMRMHVAVVHNIDISDDDLRADESTLRNTKHDTVDVYWIMDNGGITLLVPFLMRKSMFWKLRTKRVRLIGLITKLNEVGHKLQELKDLCSKYRFNDWTCSVEALSSMDGGSTEPHPQTIKTYEALPGVQPIMKQKQPFWAKRWLRIGELIRENSSKAAMVYVTMPFPRSWMRPRDWLGWCEILTSHGRPTVLIRGSGRSVMTARSE